MIEADKINSIARDVAIANLGKGAILRAISEPTTDSEGREALRIIIVLKPNVAKKLSGDKILDTLYQVQSRLTENGEERPVVVEYATDEELAQGGSA
jgi:hypothetical protein